jgi:hypothetical protein
MFTSMVAVCERGKAAPAVVSLLDQMKILGLKVEAAILVASLRCCVYVTLTPSNPSCAARAFVTHSVTAAGTRVK